MNQLSHLVKIMTGCSLLSQPKGLLPMILSTRLGCSCKLTHNCMQFLSGTVTAKASNISPKLQPQLQLPLQLGTFAPQPQQLQLHAFQTTESSLD